MTLQEFAQSLSSLKDEAKNLWGEDHKLYMNSIVGYYNGKEFMLHLLMLLQVDDPVKYLRDNKPKGKLQRGEKNA